MTACRDKLQELFRLLPHTPVYQNLLPLGAQPGWPWPRRGSDGALAVNVPFSAQSPLGRMPKPIFPPLATLTIRWDTGAPVEYRDLRFNSPWPEGDWRSACDQFPHDDIADYSEERQREAMQETYALYNQLFTAYEAHEKFNGERMERFVAHIRRLTPPGLRPFYLRLAPSFFHVFF